MPEALFINTGVMNRPVGFDIYQTFPREGDGTLVMIRYIYGHGTPPGKFTWETTVHIEGETVPKRLRKSFNGVIRPMILRMTGFENVFR